jgi:hypothetical protein
MRLPLPKRRRHWIVLAVLAPALTVSFLVSGVFSWSPLNCWHEDVDIHSGRVRHTRHLLYCQIGERVEDTWLSRNVTKAYHSPDWRHVNTFSPGMHHSPHYVYHGAINQIETLELVVDAVPFEPEARRKVADSLLTLWQNTGSDFEADDYIEKVAKIVSALHGKGASSVKASDIPDGQRSK